MFSPSTRRMVEYGLIGLAIAATLIVGLQVRPHDFLPSKGMLQIAIQSNPSAPSGPLIVACHGMKRGNVTLTSIVVSITSVSIHRSGNMNITGDWVSISNHPATLDLLQLTSSTQLGSTDVSEGTINIVRIDVESTATGSGSNGTISIVVSGSHFDVRLDAGVVEGKTTNVSIDVTPHIVCQGTGQFRLTPELHASSAQPD